MLRYALRRIGQMLPTLALAVVAVFFLARAMPGDAVSAMLGERGTDEAVARITAELGLDRSVPEQLWSYVTLLARGNLGMSIGAREGADFTKIMQIAETTLRLWPQVLQR